MPILANPCCFRLFGTVCLLPSSGRVLLAILAEVSVSPFHAALESVPNIGNMEILAKPVFPSVKHDSLLVVEEPI